MNIFEKVLQCFGKKPKSKYTVRPQSPSSSSASSEGSNIRQRVIGTTTKYVLQRQRRQDALVGENMQSRKKKTKEIKKTKKVEVKSRLKRAPARRNLGQRKSQMESDGNKTSSCTIL